MVSNYNTAGEKAMNAAIPETPAGVPARESGNFDWFDPRAQKFSFINFLAV
jgi:hypothetical protein